MSMKSVKTRRSEDEMSNAIKFRAWSPSAREMIHFGNPIVIADGTDRYGMFLKSMEGKVFIGGEHKLMQYTGVEDRREIEIYEGDIIKVIRDDCEGEYLTTVAYMGGAFMVDIHGEDYDETAVGWAIEIWDNNGDKWGVIGNIYEHEELLK